VPGCATVVSTTGRLVVEGIPPAPAPAAGAGPEAPAVPAARQPMLEALEELAAMARPVRGVDGVAQQPALQSAPVMLELRLLFPEGGSYYKLVQSRHDPPSNFGVDEQARLYLLSRARRYRWPSKICTRGAASAPCSPAPMSRASRRERRVEAGQLVAVDPADVSVALQRRRVDAALAVRVANAGGLPQVVDRTLYRPGNEDTAAEDCWLARTLRGVAAEQTVLSAAALAGAHAFTHFGEHGVDGGLALGGLAVHIAMERWPNSVLSPFVPTGARIEVWAPPQQQAQQQQARLGLSAGSSSEEEDWPSPT